MDQSSREKSARRRVLRLAVLLAGAAAIPAALRNAGAQGKMPKVQAKYQDQAKAASAAAGASTSFLPGNARWSKEPSTRMAGARFTPPRRRTIRHDTAHAAWMIGVPL
jgi:hypothetical protein